MKTFDVLVLGGGTAGTAAAKAAAQAGASVAMFNKGELGGLCILRGCMPTKTMLHAAHMAHHAEHHHTPGVSHTQPALDFNAIMQNKDAKVARFKNAKIQGIASGGYELIDAYAKFTGKDTVQADGDSYRFNKGAVIASGSNTNVPPIKGIEQVPYWTSDQVMALTSKPESCLVIGSGAIGMELAVFLARMGTQVTLASRRRVFTDLDPLITEEMGSILQAEPNLTLVEEFKASHVEQGDGQVHLHLEKDGKQRVLSAKHLLVATGRSPNLQDLDLQAAGVELDGKRVAHGADMRTSNPKVFVAGDASGQRLLLHVANWEGQVAGLGAAQVPGEHKVEQRLHMEVMFTDPPLANVGMSEAAAKKAGLPTITAVAKMAETGRAITMDVQHGVWKLVAHQETGEILGSQILGPHADDIIHIISTAMYYRGTVEDLLRMPWYHPTVSEVLLSLARQLQAQLV